MNSRLIYIVGGGHSGSTLLELLIGSAEEVVNLGEVYFFNAYNDPGSTPKLYSIHSKDCMCGKHFSECPFWHAVNQKLYTSVWIIRSNTFRENLKILWNMASPLSGYFPCKVKTGDDQVLFEAIDKILREKGKQYSYLLDSSKDPRRLVRLIQTFGKEKIVAIHLIRDGRGYVNSYNNRNKWRIKEGGQKIQNFFVCALKWILFNYMTRLYLKKQHIESIHISYELFCQNPEKYIQAINHTLSVTIPTNYLQVINTKTYHNIHGNLMKFKKIPEIKCDDSWRHELVLIKKAILAIMLFPFNRMYTWKDDVTA